MNDKGFYFIQPGPQPLYTFGLDQNNWTDGADKVTIKYSDFTTVIWKKIKINTLGLLLIIILTQKKL